MNGTPDIGTVSTTSSPIGPYGPIAPNVASNVSAAPDTTSAVVQHKVLMSIGVLIVVAIVLTQVGGINKDWAVLVGMLLIGALLMRGMNFSPSSTLSDYPFIP